MVQKDGGKMKRENKLSRKKNNAVRQVLENKN